MEYRGGLHWLTLTMRDSYLEGLRLVGDLLGMRVLAFESVGHGGMGYGCVEEGPLGARVYHETAEGDKRCTVVLPGKAMEVIDLGELKERLGALACSWRATRVDLTVDGGEFTPLDCKEEYLAGRVRTYSRRDKWEWWESGEGRTFYMGSRQSERYCRVYDRLGFTRVELECKGERAEMVVRDLVGLPLDEWGAKILGHIRDFVDFSARWWGAMISGVGRAWLRMRTAKERVWEETVAWLQHSVAPSLAVAAALLGKGYVDGLIAMGRERCTGKQRAMLAFVGVGKW